MKVGQLTCVHQYNDILYATQKDKCQVYKREEKKWVEYATVKKTSIKDFKMASNGEIFARHSNDHVYQWTGKRNEWIDMSERACDSFDLMETYFLCLDAGASAVYYRKSD